MARQPSAEPNHTTPSPRAVASAPVIQAKLTVNEVNDPFEQEADRVADQVMRMPAPPADAPPADTPPDEKNNQNKSGRAQRSQQMQRLQQPVQRSAENDPMGGATVNNDVENRVSSLDGRGEPLSDSSQEFFGSRMGADFSDVRIHRDASSAELSTDLNARAFTVGNNIAFNSGEYSPGTPDGDRLLAHELTHTVQQGAAPQVDRSVQRSETEGESEAVEGEETLPTPEEIEIALAAAAAAAAKAGAAKATGQGETELSQGNAAAEKSIGDGPRGVASASKAEGPVDDTERKTLDQTKQEKTSAKAGQQVAKATEARTRADSASETVKSIPKPPPPAPLAMPRGSSTPPSGAGLDAATATATASIETAYAESENAPDKAPISAEEDTGYTGTVTSAETVGAAQQIHEPALDEADAAQASAESPAKELEGQAQTAQVGQLELIESPPFDAAGFKASLMERIAELAPTTAQGADEFKEEGKAAQIKEGVQEKVGEEQKAAETPLKEGTAEPPDMSVAEPKPVEPLELNEPGETPSELGADKAVPKTRGEGEAEAPVKQSSEALDQQMADAEITDEQLANSNEPEFTAALEGKEAAKEESQAGVEAYRQAEQSQIEGAESEAVEAVQAATQSMFDTRTGSFADLDGKQEETKKEDEKSREKIANDINGIYEKTKTKVETILSKLDTKVSEVFDAGAAAAATAFEEFVDAKMEAYKEERYGGLLGWGKWLKDMVMGMPADVVIIYGEGRQLYIDKMDAVIDNIVQIIGTTLAEAKAEIANGKREIQEYVDQLPEDLKELGQSAAEDIQSKFDDLEQQVNDKQGELIDTLAQKYSDNLQAIDAQIEEMKAANKGLVQQAVEQMGGVIQTILELKAMLQDVLARVADAIDGIIKDPIGFLGNLLDAVKQGFNQFVGNIGTHLKQGFVSWLTGTMSSAGITLPTTFDLQGIFKLVLQVLELDTTQILDKVGSQLGVDLSGMIDAVKTVVDIHQEFGFDGLLYAGVGKIIGEENVAHLQTVVATMQQVMAGNFTALWDLVKDALDNLKEMVFGKIIDFITQEVIEKAVIKVVSMFNPVGAFIQACMMIYDVVMFFIENGERIMSLVDSVIDSVASIVAGDVGSAANLIEQSLAQAIPTAIEFLASLLGLGGLSDKVRDIIKGVRDTVDKAIQSILEWGPIKAIIGFVKGLIDKVKALIAQGIDKLKKAMGMTVDDIPPIQESFDMDGEKHEMTVQFGSNEVIMASSNPLPILTKVQLARTKIEKTKPDPEDAAARLAQLDVIERHATKIDTIITNARGNKKLGAAQAAQKVLSGPLPSLLKATKKYGSDFDAKDLDDIFGLYPYPEHGSYAEMRSKVKLESPPDGVGRTAHHAPQAVFAERLWEETNHARDDLMLANPDIKDKIKSFFDNLESVVPNIHSDSKDQLPAILIHELSHKNGRGPTPRIHRSDMKQPLMEALKQLFSDGELFSEPPSGEDEVLGKILVTLESGAIAVSPRTGHYESFFERVAEEKGITSGDITEAMENEFFETVLFLYEAEYARAIEAVKIAVGSSKVDGPDDNKRNASVDEFVTYTDNEWRKLLNIK